MLQIRYGIFESNSSSTHTLCVAQNEEIDKLDKNELLINLDWQDARSFISPEEAMESLKKCIEDNNDEEGRELLANNEKEGIYQLMREYEIAQRYDDYLDSEWLDSYQEEFTTKSGDRVLVFGIYGRDC